MKISKLKVRAIGDRQKPMEGNPISTPCVRRPPPFSTHRQPAPPSARAAAAMATAFRVTDANGAGKRPTALYPQPGSATFKGSLMNCCAGGFCTCLCKML